MHLLLDALDTVVGTPLRILLATAAAFLPARYWERFDERLPVRQAAWFSSMLTLLAGVGAGLLWSIEARTPLPDYLLFHPKGWAATYVILSGFSRLAASVTDQAMGDPLLTLLDSRWAGRAQRHVTEQAAATRASLEGPVVRDQWVRASELGIDGADWVIVASRRKDGWTPGTTLIRQDEWYRIVSVSERTIKGRLRTLYALVPQPPTEAARHIVRYD